MDVILGKRNEGELLDLTFCARSNRLHEGQG
jgi:hypothetical protein